MHTVLDSNSFCACNVRMLGCMFTAEVEYLHGGNGGSDAMDPMIDYVRAQSCI